MATPKFNVPKRKKRAHKRRALKLAKDLEESRLLVKDSSKSKVSTLPPSGYGSVGKSAKGSSKRMGNKATENVRYSKKAKLDTKKVVGSADYVSKVQPKPVKEHKPWWIKEEPVTHLLLQSGGKNVMKNIRVLHTGKEGVQYYVVEERPVALYSKHDAVVVDRISDGRTHTNLANRRLDKSARAADKKAKRLARMERRTARKIAT